MTDSPVAVRVTLADLVDRARRLAVSSGRVILGITGPPGAGKSTLSAALVGHIQGLAVGLPMDGFHLANSELVRLGRQSRKGAPDTFDAAGYVALLRRIKDERTGTVYAPEFRRQIEEPIAGAIAIPPDLPLVIAEGNYLLLDTGPWAGIRELLAEAWYLDPGGEDREQWLIERHMRYGRSRDDAAAWVATTDGPNARLIATSRGRADLIIKEWA